MRNIYIMGISLFLGISLSQYFVMNTDYYSGHGPVRSNGGWVSNLIVFPIKFISRENSLLLK